MLLRTCNTPIGKHMASPNTLLKLANTLLSPCEHLA